jgi:hypothetical protein
MYRVYLLPEWREFGLDYATRDRAKQAAGSYHASFPHRRYVVRRVLPHTNARRPEKTTTSSERR